MKKLVYTTQFKKDLKKFQTQPQKLAMLKNILEILKAGKHIPRINRPHNMMAY